MEQLPKCMKNTYRTVGQIYAIYGKLYKRKHIGRAIEQMYEKILYVAKVHMFEEIPYWAVGQMYKKFSMGIWLHV